MADDPEHRELRSQHHDAAIQLSTFLGESSQYTVPASACNAATPLQPGVYVDGIVNNQTCPTVYMATGVYILKGGGFYQASATNTITNVPGGGAMIFNTHSN